jgi:hypothetical protein
MQQFDCPKLVWFFCLPMGLMRQPNLGQTFANFKNTVGASRFEKAFNKYEWNVGSNNKTYKVCLLTIQQTSIREPPFFFFLSWDNDLNKNAIKTIMPQKEIKMYHDQWLRM